MNTFEQSMKEAYLAGFKESGFKVDELLIDVAFSAWFKEYMKKETVNMHVAPIRPAATIAARYGDRAKGAPPGMVPVKPVTLASIPLDQDTDRIASYAEGRMSLDEFLKGCQRG